MPNRLAESTSPYLLQHKDNPVDWFEWGEEAFDLATETDRPVLLSVGYSACHWCHVMAHESFEDDATAQYMNANFVNVKVDREERPDVDRIYMDALQAMSGHGGWPMTVFMTPTGEPFFAGTYFPKDARGHMASFRQILESVAAAWVSQRSEITEQAGRLAAAVRSGIPPAEPAHIDQVVANAIKTLVANHDPQWGGFGGAPKFPQTPVLEFLLRSCVLDPATGTTIEPVLRKTLDEMRAGGIYDQAGGGFARYSVDDRWLIPHFEKMLYDNALLARVYLRAGQVFGDSQYTKTATEILDYLATGMRDEAGGIHAAEDADSEGIEGKYYVWTKTEFEEIAGHDSAAIGMLYGITEAGNFEGSNNLHLAMSATEVASNLGLNVDSVVNAKKRVDRALLSARAQRVPPGRDDKIIAAWNGLALRAFAEAAAVLRSAEYLTIAVDIARFVTERMVNTEGRLLRSWRQGKTSGPGFCDDYASMAVGLFTLYQVTGDTHWYQKAENLTRSMIELFGDDDGFFSPGIDAADLIARPKDFADNPLPSANSLAAEAIVLLSAYTGDSNDHIAGISRGAGRLLEHAPSAVGHLLSVLMTLESGIKEVAVVGDPERRPPLEQVVWETFRPDCVLASATAESSVPLLEDRAAKEGSAAVHVCRNFVCDLPVGTPEEMRRLLDPTTNLSANSPRTPNGS